MKKYKFKRLVCSTYNWEETMNRYDEIGYHIIHISIPVDYNGLIEKGLAIEAPEGMYN